MLAKAQHQIFPGFQVRGGAGSAEEATAVAYKTLQDRHPLRQFVTRPADIQLDCGAKRALSSCQLMGIPYY